MNFNVLYVNGRPTFPLAKKIPTSRAFDINLRSIIAFGENGKGHTGLESVCSYLNLVPPMNKNAYNKLLLTAKSSYTKRAEICMKTAADEVQCLAAEEKHDTVSENSNITMLKTVVMALIVLLFRIVLLMMSLLLILLFQVMVLGRKGDMTHSMVL